MQFENKGCTVYSVNANLMSRLNPLTDKELEEEAKKLIDNFHKKHKNTYYMALCHDIRYFTVYNTKPDKEKFDIDESVTFGDEVIECTFAIGKIVDVAENDRGDTIEIWIKNAVSAHCVLLFPYDNGMIQVGEQFYE